MAVQRTAVPSPAGLELDVARVSAPEQVAAALRRAIMAGELQPGQPVTEAAVSSAANIGRSTAREALKLLAQQRLVVHHRHRGASVVSPSEDDIVDVFRTRELLELAGIGGWDGASDSARERVGVGSTELEAAAAAAPSWEVLSDRDMDFHAAIVGLRESARVSEAFAGLRTEVQFYASLLFAGNVEAEDPVAVAAEHTAIYEAMRDGDGARAAGLMRHLLDVNRGLLIGLLDGFGHADHHPSTAT